MNTINSIQVAIHDLLNTDPWFAHFLLSCKMIYCEKTVPTAGVCFQNGIPTFIFNRDFMATLTRGQAKAVIKHEVMHLMFRHTDKALSDMLKNKYPNIANIHELSNVAMDCAINQYVDDLPENGVTLKLLSDKVGHQLEAFKTSDYYLDAILKSPNTKQKQVASMSGAMDEHLKDEGETPSEVAQATIDKIAQEAVKKSAGNVPQNILKHIGSLPEPKLNWKTLLKNFVSRHVIHETKASYKKLNRRFDLPVPGRVRKKTMTLGVCVDSSGSISNESWAAFMGEVQAIAKQVTKLYLLDADCVVQNVTLVKNKKIDGKRHGNGGTAYQPAIDECFKLKCDAIVFFGDFDCADTPVLKHPVPFIWVGVGNQKPPAAFGNVVRL